MEVIRSEVVEFCGVASRSPVAFGVRVKGGGGGQRFAPQREAGHQEEGWTRGERGSRVESKRLGTLEGGGGSEVDQRWERGKISLQAGNAADPLMYWILIFTGRSYQLEDEEPKGENKQKQKRPKKGKGG